MKNVKKLEIITSTDELPEIASILEELGLSAYSAIKDVAGKGDRGERGVDGLTEAFKNCYVMVACPPEKAGDVVDAVRPLLKKSGGICLVSDAHWMVH